MKLLASILRNFHGKGKNSPLLCASLGALHSHLCFEMYEREVNFLAAIFRALLRIFGT